MAHESKDRSACAFALIALLVAGMVSTAGTALAVTVPDDPQGIAVPKGQDEISIEGLISEIENLMVTARRRQESVLETPVSVTSVNSAVLLDQDIRDLSQIGDMVPGLQIKQSLQGAPTIFVRGIGQRDVITDFDPGVAVYVDGAYLSRLDGSLLSTLDVERVEVMRGPQGTLYGKNAVGGAINFISRKPSPEYEAFGEFRGGAFETYDARATVNIPILADTLYSRFSFGSAHSAGYMENKRDRADWSNNRLLSVLGAFRYLPTDTLTFDLSGRWSRERERAQGTGCVVTSKGFTGGATDLGALIDMTNEIYFGPGNTTGNSMPWSDGGGGGGIEGSRQESYLSSCASSGTGENLDFESDTEGFYRLDTAGLTLNGAWEAPTFGSLNSLDVKSITSFQRQELENDIDVDGSSMQLITQSSIEPRVQTQASQELQLSGTAFDDSLTFVVGLYGFWEFSEDGTYENRFGNSSGLYLPCGLVIAPANQAAAGCTTATNPGIPVPSNYAIQIGGTANTRNEIFNSSYAAFTQLRYNVFEWLEVSSGVRYSYETKGLDRLTNDPVAPMPHERVERDFQRVTPMASIRAVAPGSWLDVLHLDRASVYFTYSQGFKSGGYSSRNDPLTGSPTPFAQEVVDAFEIGQKVVAWDGRLFMTTSFFWNDYHDIQLTIVRTSLLTGRPSPAIDNAGKAVVRGFEFEGQLRPIEGLKLQGNLALTDAFYENFIDADPVNPSIPLDRSDEPFFNLPELDLSMQISYDLDMDRFGLTKWGILTPSFDTTYKTTTYYHFSPGGYASGAFQEGAGWLMNARLGWMSHDDRFSVNVWVKNLADRRYIKGALDLSDTNGGGALGWGAPRTVGVTASIRL